MALPRQHSNPLAIIQRPPDPWQGLKGSTSGGFLIFSSVAYGVRAGFINLINAYLKRGLNTIEKILPVYAPSGHGANNPEAYITAVVNLTGISRNTPITTREQLKKLGKAITIVEEGTDWVSATDMDQGFAMALQTRPWPSGTTAPVPPTPQTTTQQAGAGIGMLLILLAGGLYFFNQRKKA